mmetsp:Transcript_17737/g.67424  ORF Transcript_17737/g.67424 Transcript_17737/m.67424 type:complete len:83 (+) Transcript_17737:586-834(+)
MRLAFPVADGWGSALSSVVVVARRRWAEQVASTRCRCLFRDSPKAPAPLCPSPDLELDQPPPPPMLLLLLLWLLLQHFPLDW